MTELYTKAELAKLLKITGRTIDRLREAGDFPAPIQLSPRRIAWKAETIEVWMSGR